MANCSEYLRQYRQKCTNPFSYDAVKLKDYSKFSNQLNSSRSQVTNDALESLVAEKVNDSNYSFDVQ